MTTADLITAIEVADREFRGAQALFDLASGSLDTARSNANERFDELEAAKRALLSSICGE